MSRWLHNVNAVQAHFHSSDTSIRLQPIQWWGTNQSRRSRTTRFGKTSAFHIGEFIGQGRRMQYCGLVPAVLEKAEQFDFGGRMKPYNNCATAVIERFSGRRPLRWYGTAAVSLFLVWSQVLMAFMLAYNTPTVGIGCWSGGYFLYGVFSSVSWVVQLSSKRPGRWTRLFCHLANAVSLCWLIAFSMLVVCLCSPQCLSS